MATSPVTNVSNEVLASILPTFSWPDRSVQVPFHTHKEIKPAPSTPAALPLEMTAAKPIESPARREQILLEHLPLVRFVARRIHERLPQHIELDDLVSAGMLGLLDAYNKFDAGKNVQFRSYAQFRIRGAILDSLRSNDWGSRELRRQARSIEEAVQKLTQQLSRRPSENEIAAELGMALGEYQELTSELKSLEIGSLHETRGEDSADEELAYVAAPPEEDPFHQCVKREMSAHLVNAIAALPERDARVLALYYVEEMTLKEIGVVLGLVESRVSQIRAAAVVNLRARMASGGKSDNRKIRIVPKPHHPHVPAAVLHRSAVIPIRSTMRTRLVAL